MPTTKSQFVNGVLIDPKGEPRLQGRPFLIFIHRYGGLPEAPKGCTELLERSLIVLFSDVIDSRSSQSIIAHTARSAVRHLPLVVALRNDHLMSIATPVDRRKSDELFESAAAEELVSAREEALIRMRRAGVSVLDVSPQQMSAAVINRYLELKARASL